jgi:lipopolysaccharide/colanic/teichoic acid biosynthesis glycosyltransferase
MTDTALSSTGVVIIGVPRVGYAVVKRAVDLALATLLLLALAPLLLTVAALVALETPGGPLYVSERIGSRRRLVDGVASWEPRPFRLYKFRSMTVDADSSVHKAHIEAYVAGTLRADGRSNAPFKLCRDARVTRVGRILRRTSIDELPQLLNVLRGEMSLVGPRPLPPYEIALYDCSHMQRFAATPGITGLWQVSGRCALPFDRMQALDAEYVERQSLVLDLKILLRTIPAVVGGRGAS